MRFFKWICWLRGYHVSDFAITAYDPPQEPGARDSLYGKYGPCRCCGFMLAEGIYNENHRLQIRYSVK